jgi:hypothetical protein
MNNIQLPNMKKTIIFITSLLFCLALGAQPRGMGLRIGATGIEASYQHSTQAKKFMQIDFGMDLGYNVNGRPGAKAAFTYDFIWAEPAWTARGTWSLYSGPGATLGFVDDIVPYDIEGNIKGFHDNGMVIGAHVDIGLEYTFNIPLSIALNVRPCFGIHINDGKFTLPGTDIRVNYGAKAGFYDNGLLGFVPSVALRYRF